MLTRSSPGVERCGLLDALSVEILSPAAIPITFHIALREHDADLFKAFTDTIDFLARNMRYRNTGRPTVNNVPY